MTKAENYSVVVRRVVLNGEAVYEARVKEFPDLTEYADSADEAYALAIDAVETVAAIYAEKGRAMPAIADVAQDFSGRVTLRLPKSLHRALSDAAEEEDVSLNQHLVNVLCYFTGFAHAERVVVQHWMPVKISAAPKAHLRLVSERPLMIAANDWPVSVHA